MKPSPPPPAHSVDVRHAHRLLESAQVHRQRHFQLLVRHFLSQILHGCKSAYCSTPTCLSSNRRNPSKPLRPPTHLTACALAHHLASQDNPHHALCPHELKVSPAALEIDGALGTALRPGSSTDTRQYAVYPAPSSLDARSAHGQRAHQAVVDAVHKRRQAKKDVKSLGQNLYDSVTVIYSYSKQIPSPSSVLATLRAPDDQNKSPAPTNGQPVNTRATHSSSLARQHSQEDLRAQSHADSSSTPLRHDHVHRIPYHPPVTARPSSFDSATESPRLSITKTGRKSFTLGGSIPPMSRVNPSPTVEKHSSKGAPPAAGSGQSVLVAPTLSCDVLDRLKTQVHHHRRNQSTDFNFVVDYDSNRRFRPAKPFVNRSLFYTLSDTETLLQSFHDNSESFKDSPLPHLDSARLTHSFRDWNQRNGALIFDALWVTVEALFVPPPEIDTQKSPRLKPSLKNACADGSQKPSTQKDATSTKPRYLSNKEAAHIVVVCIHALTSLVPVGWAHTWAQLRKLRSWGIVVPNATPNSDDYADPYLNIIDELEYEPALRLTDRLLRGIGTRNCFEHILATLHNQDEQEPSMVQSFLDVVFKHLEVAEQAALASKRRMNTSLKPNEDPGWTITATFMEWLRTTIIKQWNSRVELNKWSNVGTAVRLLDKLYHWRHQLNLHSNMFVMPFFNEHVNITVDPMKFLDWKEQPNTLHIFQYPHLFPIEYLVAYFRTINLTSMMAQYDHTQRVYQMQRTLEVILKEPYLYMIKHRLKVTLQDYLVLNVSREEPLTDTLDQIWGQEKKMLLKPLKVKMGEQEGEVGLDHGGVSSEFFRVVLSEAFLPDNGMFTLEAQSRMMWFQPGTLEPLWRFEMLGVLFSLAVYNGITLPVTFPLALYRYLLQPHSNLPQGDSGLELIRDGWPSLAKSLEELLSWSDGDVGDVIMRDYAFSFEVFGQKVDHDMKSPFPHHDPTSLSVLSNHTASDTELPLVTNANRVAFVRDYISYLTYTSVAPQLCAFKKGFMTCLHPRSLLLFTPPTLRHLIEGTQHISIPSLRQCARYEDTYSATHPAIITFWSIVSQYSQDDCRALLEFVTASDRVPITGYESITFHIVPMGGDTENLPTSSTCFGKLYLPDYSAREKMEAKLGLAIRNSTGFGVI